MVPSSTLQTIRNGVINSRVRAKDKAFLTSIRSLFPRGRISEELLSREVRARARVRDYAYGRKHQPQLVRCPSSHQVMNGSVSGTLLGSKSAPLLAPRLDVRLRIMLYLLFVSDWGPVSGSCWSRQGQG